MKIASNPVKIASNIVSLLKKIPYPTSQHSQLYTEKISPMIFYFTFLHQQTILPSIKIAKTHFVFLFNKNQGSVKILVFRFTAIISYKNTVLYTLIFFSTGKLAIMLGLRINVRPYKFHTDIESNTIS